MSGQSINTAKSTHIPHVDGHIFIEDAIRDVIATTGMTRRNAIRWIKKGIREGKLRITTISRKTELPTDPGVDEICRQIDAWERIQNP